MISQSLQHVIGQLKPFCGREKSSTQIVDQKSAIAFLPNGSDPESEIGEVRLICSTWENVRRCASILISAFQNSEQKIADWKNVIAMVFGLGSTDRESLRLEVDVSPLQIRSFSPAHASKQQKQR